MPIEATPAFDGRTAAALRRAHLARLAFWAVIAIAAAAAGATWFASRLPQPVAIGEQVSRATPEMPQQQLARDNNVTGVDSANLPFRIGTTRGYQDKTDSKLYHLEQVAGTFRRDNGKDLDVRGDTGTYHATDKLLHLDGQVVVAEAPRFEAHMAKAVFDLNKRELTSTVPVHVKLDNGDITADSLVAENNGEKMYFKGRVKARFNSPPSGGGEGVKQ